MKRAALMMGATALLVGCLEVEQHPPWVNGAYAGKSEQRTSGHRFNGDRPAWRAALTERNHWQDEYRRTGR